MEKQKPHYLLKAIQAQMSTPEMMNLTRSALEGIRAIGLSQADALAAIQDLTGANFYKSMTVHADHRTWQDVYHAEWQEISLYIKFQQAGEYFVISFMER
jgi:motility quorum-sensing regulator/GCU-specific mRNA interferase toxin